MKKPHVLMSGLAVSALVLSACGLGGSADSGAASQSIVIDQPFAPKSGWALETDDAQILSQAGCLETLVKYDTDGTLKPLLAVSWTQADATTWDVKLRPGVKFQDGTPLDAKSVADALTHSLKAKTPAKAFSPKVVSSVVAQDDSTVRFTTVKPDILLPYRLASPNTGILAPEAYAGMTINPVGTCTGPFTITQEIPQQAIKLTRNGSYWGAPAKIAAAELRFIPDGQTRATQARSGEAQIVTDLPVSAQQSLKGNTDIKVISEASSRTTALMLNNKKAPFDNDKVRQAIQAAVDVTAINNAVYQGKDKPAVGPFAPNEAWAPQGATPVTIDPAKARSLLAEAGVDPASIHVTLRSYTERAEFGDLATVIQQELKAIGITVTISTGQAAAIEPDLLAGNFDMALLSRNHLNEVSEPAGFLTSDYTCAGTYNISHFCDPSFDALVQKAGATTDPAARSALYAQAASVLQSRAVDVFLVHETKADAISSRIGGFSLHPYYTLTADTSLAAS